MCIGGLLSAVFLLGNRKYDYLCDDLYVSVLLLLDQCHGLQHLPEVLKHVRTEAKHWLRPKEGPYEVFEVHLFGHPYSYERRFLCVTFPRR